MNTSRWNVVLGAEGDAITIRYDLEELAAHLAPVVEAGGPFVAITVNVIEHTAADAESYAVQAIGRALKKAVHVVQGATLVVE